jgi:hypothetical protein
MSCRHQAQLLVCACVLKIHRIYMSSLADIVGVLFALQARLKKSRGLMRYYCVEHCTGRMIALCP